MKKGEIEMSTIVAIIALLAGLLIIGSIVWVAVGGITTEGLRKYGCWVSNGFKSSNILFKATLPSACEIFNMEQPVNEEILAAIMKEAWWMYGKGDWDYNLGDDHEIMVFYFSVDHDIDLDQYGAGEDFIYGYLPSHSDGMLTEKYTSSDYFYLTKNSEGGSICLGRYAHKNAEETGRRILEKVDERGRPKTYYIMFWDDASILGQGKEYGDKIVIAGKPNLKQEGAYYCEVPLEPSQRLKIVQTNFGDKVNTFRGYIANQMAKTVGL